MDDSRKLLEEKLLAAPHVHDKIDHSLSEETCGTLSRNLSREHRHSNQREENLSNLENVGLIFLYIRKQHFETRVELRATETFFLRGFVFFMASLQWAS